MFGIKGYLATITSAAEYTCTDSKIAGAWGWIGASDRACERDASCGDATNNTDTASAPTASTIQRIPPMKVTGTG